MNSARRILNNTRSTITALTRQIDIQTSQPLRNIAERRCLLNALQKFGEVATFLPGKDNNNSKISAIYETPEAAFKAVDASPMTILLHSHLPPSTPSRADSSTHEHEHVVNVDIHPNATSTTTDHEERISKNTWNNYHTGYTWDKLDPAIKNDPRIQDVIAAGAPRGVFADGVIDASYLRNGQDETVMNRKDGRTKTTVELKESLLALLEE